MFQKIKNIKKYIKLAKIGGIIFAGVFIMMLGMIVLQQFQIHDLSVKVKVLEGR
jgi:hypothetical protein